MLVSPHNTTLKRGKKEQKNPDKEKHSYQNNEGNWPNETPDKTVIYVEPATVMKKERWMIILTF